MGLGTYLREARGGLERFLARQGVAARDDGFAQILPRRRGRQRGILLHGTRGPSSRPYQLPHGAMHIPRTAMDGAVRFSDASPTPAVVYDHARGLYFTPMGIGMEVLTCSILVSLRPAGNAAERDSLLRLGVFPSSAFLKGFRARVVLVDMASSEAKLLFVLMRRNPEEPTRWAQLFDFFLGSDTSNHLSVRQGHSVYEVREGALLERELVLANTSVRMSDGTPSCRLSTKIDRD